MAPKAAVDRLNEAERDFVITAHMRGLTDREISAAFEEQFRKKLAKSSIQRWRAKAGEQSTDKYRLIHLLADQLKEDLHRSGEENYKLIFENIDDHVLMSAREVFNADPVRVLGLRVEESKRQLKEKELELRREELALKRETAEREANAKADRFGIAMKVWQTVLGFCLKKEPSAADVLTKHSKEILGEVGKQIEGTAV
jgi:hypothetical protein